MAYNLERRRYLFYFIHDRGHATLATVALPLLDGMLAYEGEHATILTTRKKEHAKRWRKVGGGRMRLRCLIWPFLYLQEHLYFFLVSTVLQYISFFVSTSIFFIYSQIRRNCMSPNSMGSLKRLLFSHLPLCALGATFQY